jgi:hypothetical protein
MKTKCDMYLLLFNTNCDWINTKCDWINTKRDWINTKCDWINTHCDWINDDCDWINTDCDWINTKCDWVNTDCDVYLLLYHWQSGAEKKLQKARITLNDCLACSGCITSAESVLITQQSQEELYSVLQQNLRLHEVRARE